MTLENYRPLRNWAPHFTLLLLAFLIASVSCKRSVDNSANGNAPNANSTVAVDETSSTPPFPTKEPERYQATRITSGSGGPQTASIPGLSAATNRQVFVARDGDKRREESEMLAGIKIVYLQLSSGRYLLLPARKLYAEIELDGSDNPVNSTEGVPSDFAPGKLINEAPAGAKYEKLGTEEISGRMTTKYRVTTGGGDGLKTASETIIWADESLGMPIKSETTSTDGAKYSMEMRDIKLEVDPALFELPKDYRKIEHSELLSNALPSVKELLGAGDQNKATRKR